MDALAAGTTTRSFRLRVGPGRAGGGLGIFAAGDPLRLEPFKVRYLSRRRLSDRCVIYLSDGGVFLISSQEYPTVSEA